MALIKAIEVESHECAWTASIPPGIFLFTKSSKSVFVFKSFADQICLQSKRFF